MSVLDGIKTIFVGSTSEEDLKKIEIFDLDLGTVWHGPVGIDTETTGLHFMDSRVRLLQIGTPTQSLVIDLDLFRDEDGVVDWGCNALRPVTHLLVGNRPKILQNAAFDLVFLLHEGVTVGGSIFDTMIASKIINNGTGASNALDAITKRLLDVDLPKENQKANWGGELSEDMVLYAGRDAAILTHLVPPLKHKLEHSQVSKSVTLWDVFALEMQALRPIAHMRWHGFPFSGEAAVQLREELQEEACRREMQFLEALDTEIREKHPEDETKWLPRNEDGTINNRAKSQGRGKNKVLAGINSRSPQQVAKALTDAGIILPPSVPKGKIPAQPKVSLDQNLLAFLRPEYPLIDQYLTFKESATSVSSIETLLKHVRQDGRIHGNYNQVGTDTGRLSASDPNLQQVKRDKRFRDLFVAPEGYLFVAADFSQIELRVAAELSGEPRMIEAYLAGRDLHTETAALMLSVALEEVTKEQRTSAKIANFGLLYGAGAATLQRQAMAQYGVYFTMKEAHGLVNGFRAAYPVLYEWQQREGGGTSAAVLTRYGRRRILVGFNDKYTVRINTQVQGTAGDIAKIAMATLWRKHLYKTAAKEAALISMVHDEIILLVREDRADVWGGHLKGAMESAGSMLLKKVPVVADLGIGPTWGSVK